MKKQLEHVKKFHEVFNHPIADEPTLVDKSLWFLRGTLLGEELEEYAEACIAEDLVAVADALADQLYILLGTMHVHGMAGKMEEIFDEVQRSNMSKLAEDGTPILRADGKILKGPDFTEPDIKSILDDGKE